MTRKIDSFMVWFLSQPSSEVKGKTDAELYDMYDDWRDAQDAQAEADEIDTQQRHYLHDLSLRSNGVGGVL